MKKYTFLIIILIFLHIPVSADDAIPFYYNEDIEELIGYGTLSELVDAIVDGETPDKNNVLEKIFGLIFGEITNSLKYISAIIGFSLLGACIKSTDPKPENGSGDLLFLITYCVISLFLLGILKDCVEIAKNVSEQIDNFVKMTIPAYISFVVSLMPLRSIANLEGIFLIMVNVVSTFSGKIMLNTFFYIGLLYIINYMSTEIRILKLTELLRQTMFWILGFLLTVFAGITGLSGISTVAVTNSGMNAVKYTVGHAVPIVGGFLADSSELLFASAKIFKNAFGTAGIIILIVICIMPILKLFISGILLKAAAGFTEPFCDKRICDCISAIGQTIIHIMVCVILSLFMFILAFATILLVGMGG